MPTKPRTFRPSHYTPPAPSLSSADKRIRGRAGMRLRAQVLREEPICRMCLAGADASPEVVPVYASEEVDHILPLSQGGTEARENKQGLCAARGVDHHAQKTAADASRRALKT